MAAGISGSAPNWSIRQRSENLLEMINSAKPVEEHVREGKIRLFDAEVDAAILAPHDHVA